MRLYRGQSLDHSRKIGATLAWGPGKGMGKISSSLQHDIGSVAIKVCSENIVEESLLKQSLMMSGYGKIAMEDQVTKCLDVCCTRQEFDFGRGRGEMQLVEENCGWEPLKPANYQTTR